jgi:hypothetical protein
MGPVISSLRLEIGICSLAGKVTSTKKALSVGLCVEVPSNSPIVSSNAWMGDNTKSVKRKANATAMVAVTRNCHPVVSVLTKRFNSVLLKFTAHPTSSVFL